MLSQKEIKELRSFANEIRKKTIYNIGKLGVGHIGGSLSIEDVLALLYGKEMKYKPENPLWPDRDILILSKGHAGPALYATLALKGFFPLEWLDTLNKGGTRLPSHCDRVKTPGIDMSTGSLGQGLSVACGLAYAHKIDVNPSYVYVILGDGEIQEGQNWEAGMFAAQYKLSRLIAFIDYNNMQIDDSIDKIIDVAPLQEKWESFGWYTQRINGHDFEALHKAVCNAKRQGGKPSMIILDTIKGKGAAFCEGKISNHNMNIDAATAENAIAELDKME